MRKTLPLFLLAALVLAGCARVADSRLNPLNWFGQSRAVATTQATGPLRPLVPEGARTAIVDARPAVETVTALRVDRTPQGAIVTATGVAATQGAFNAQLVPVARSGGTLTLAFRAELPAGFAAIGPAQSRSVTAAYLLDAAELAGLSTIRVSGRTNARETRR